MTDPLVSADWLAAKLDEVAVLDATYYMPADPGRSRADFAASRIPGARLFEIDTISAPDSDLPHMLPDAATFGAAMAALGIDGSRPVVVYDRSVNHFSAPRVWFTLRLYGLPDVKVLNGGLAAWTAAGHATASGAADHTTVAPRQWQMDDARVMAGTDMAARVAAGDTQVIDARARERFDGTAPEPRPGLRSGHMPGAACVPFTALTGPNGLFQDNATLRELFADTGQETAVVTCGSGMTACVLALGLHRLGRDAILYDGSWAEWGQGELGQIRP